MLKSVHYAKNEHEKIYAVNMKYFYLVDVCNYKKARPRIYFEISDSFVTECVQSM